MEPPFAVRPHDPDDDIAYRHDYSVQRIDRSDAMTMLNTPRCSKA